MNKQELIKQLTDLMATVQMAYFKGRMEGHSLWVHERRDDSNAISIDLYNFGGDGKPVCDGLNPCTITYDDNTQESGWLFCMGYDPDDDVTPLEFLFDTEDDSGDMVICPEDVPEEALKNIIAWLQQAMKPLPEKPKTNDVTSFFFYMWNTWCKEECQKAFSAPGNCWQHFWNKWCAICEKHSVYGAAERFYAELSNNNRDLLVKRATEVYEGDSEKH